jgi:hypothetical protein
VQATVPTALCCDRLARTSPSVRCSWPAAKVAVAVSLGERGRGFVVGHAPVLPCQETEADFALAKLGGYDLPMSFAGLARVQADRAGRRRLRTASARRSRSRPSRFARSGSRYGRSRRRWGKGERAVASTCGLARSASANSTAGRLRQFTVAPVTPLLTRPSWARQRPATCPPSWSAGM